MQGKDVGTEGGRGRKVPAISPVDRSDVPLARVGDDLPVARGFDRHFKAGLEVGLVEARKNAVGLVGLQVAVEVHSVVGRIFKAMQPRAVIRVVVRVGDLDPVQAGFQQVVRKFEAMSGVQSGDGSRLDGLGIDLQGANPSLRKIQKERRPPSTGASLPVELNDRSSLEVGILSVDGEPEGVTHLPELPLSTGGLFAFQGRAK